MGSWSDESIRCREGWQKGDAVFCQITLDICYYITIASSISSICKWWDDCAICQDFLEKSTDWWNTGFGLLCCGSVWSKSLTHQIRRSWLFHPRDRGHSSVSTTYADWDRAGDSVWAGLAEPDSEWVSAICRRAISTRSTTANPSVLCQSDINTTPTPQSLYHHLHSVAIYCSRIRNTRRHSRTKSSATANKPRDELCHLKPCQLLYICIKNFICKALK